MKPTKTIIAALVLTLSMNSVFAAPTCEKVKDDSREIVKRLQKGTSIDWLRNTLAEPKWTAEFGSAYQRWALDILEWVHADNDFRTIDADDFASRQATACYSQGIGTYLQTTYVDTNQKPVEPVTSQQAAFDPANIFQPNPANSVEMSPETVETIGTVLGVAAVIGLAVLGIKYSGSSNKSTSKQPSVNVPKAEYATPVPLAKKQDLLKPIEYPTAKPKIDTDLKTVQIYTKPACTFFGEPGCR